MAKRENNLTHLYLSEPLFRKLAETLRAVLPQGNGSSHQGMHDAAREQGGQDGEGASGLVTELVKLGWSGEQARRGAMRASTCGGDGIATVDGAVDLCVRLQAHEWLTLDAPG